MTTESNKPHKVKYIGNVSDCTKYLNKKNSLNKSNHVNPPNKKPINTPILNIQTQTEFTSQDSIQESGEFISVEGVPRVEVQQIKLSNNLIQNNNKLYFHTPDSQIFTTNQYEDSGFSKIKTTNSQCSIEFDRLSSDTSDHQYDYDYQDPTEYYITAYDRKHSPINSIDLNKIDNVIKRNTQNLKNIERKNERYANSFLTNTGSSSTSSKRDEKSNSTGKKNESTKITNKVNTKTKPIKPGKRLPQSSPKLTGKPSMIPKIEVKTYVSSVSYGNVTEIKNQQKNDTKVIKTSNGNNRSLAKHCNEDYRKKK